jgi:hypothetical protein
MTPTIVFYITLTRSQGIRTEGRGFVDSFVFPRCPCLKALANSPQSSHPVIDKELTSLLKQQSVGDVFFA